MTADTDHAPGLGAGLAAQIELTLGRVADSLDRWSHRYEQLQQSWQDVHPVPILPGQVPLSGGAGTLDVPDVCGPKDGLWWDVRRLTTWGWTAGTVTVYLNSTAGEQLAQNSVVGQFTWSGQILLGPRDRLVFQASGITGTVNLAGQAFEVDARALPAYLI